MFCFVCLDNQLCLVEIKNCQCSFCYNCAINWIEELIKQKQNTNSFRCLNYKCEEEINFEKFHQSITSQNIMDRFQQIMLKNYLQSTQDIRPCPNRTCNYYGFVPKQRCNEDFYCSQCKFVWVDKQYLTYSKIIKLTLNQLKNNNYTIICKFMITQNCPKCNCQIMKFGGCSHMMCNQCQTFFCWNCKNDLGRHSDMQCVIIRFTYFSLVLQNFVISFYLLNIHRYLYLLFYPFYGLVIIIIYNLVVLLPIVIIVSCTYRFNIKKKKWINYIMECIYTILMEGSIYLIFIDYVEITYEQLMNYHYYQGILIGIYGIYWGLKKLIYKVQLQYQI